MQRSRRRSASIVLLVVTTSVAAYVWWHRWQKPDEDSIYSPQEPNYSQIEEGLYLGGSVREPPQGTRAVVNLCEVDDVYHCDFEDRAKIADAAPAPSIDWLRARVKFVETQRQAGITTYVHCLGGISRAGMVTTAYLMKKNNWGRDEALAFVKRKRPQVDPNAAFRELLKEWETEKDKMP